MSRADVPRDTIADSEEGPAPLPQSNAERSSAHLPSPHEGDVPLPLQQRETSSPTGLQVTPAPQSGGGGGDGGDGGRGGDELVTQDSLGDNIPARQDLPESHSLPANINHQSAESTCPQELHNPHNSMHHHPHDNTHQDPCDHFRCDYRDTPFYGSRGHLTLNPHERGPLPINPHEHPNRELHDLHGPGRSPYDSSYSVSDTFRILLVYSNTLAVARLQSPPSA
jgi:hypothetical protein